MLRIWRNLRMAAWVATMVAGRVAVQAAPPTVSTLWKFHGANASAVTLAIHDGVRYGVTMSGGPVGNGTIFELKAPAAPGGAWSQKVLYSFQGGSDGVGPTTLVAGDTGMLYGTTTGGGANNTGTVFALSRPAGGAWTHQVLYSFAGGTDGSTPNFLAFRDGTLYGTTPMGGVHGMGTVYELSPPTSGTDWTETILFNFLGGNRGAAPNNIVLDGSGNIYGTTAGTGGSSSGTVFELTPPTSGSGHLWTGHILHVFLGTTDGAQPEGLALGPDGTLYGTTYTGGTNNGGTVFRLEPGTSGGPARKSTLYNFGGSVDAVNPNAPPIFSDGAVYGTTEWGGSMYLGTVFELSHSAGNWSEKVIYEFLGEADGSEPGGLVAGSNGSLDCVSRNHNGGNGAVLELTPPAVSGGTWTTDILYGFGRGSDGASPAPGLAADGNGALYGAAALGGSGYCKDGGEQGTGCGVVFRLTPPAQKGRPWTSTILYNFPGKGGRSAGNGAGPSPVVLDSNGVVYGTTESGGSAANGAIYTLTPPPTAGTQWKYTELYGIKGGIHGDRPNSALVWGDNGVLYGTTALGGAHHSGTIYQLTPPATAGSSWSFATIYDFNGSDFTTETLTYQNGILYGAAWGKIRYRPPYENGLIFQLAPPAVAGGAWQYTELHSFSEARQGTNPSGIVLDSNGNIYGVTSVGGANCSGSGGCGTVFELSPPATAGGSWSYTVLYNFTAGGKGGLPCNYEEGKYCFSLALYGGTLVGTTTTGSRSKDCRDCGTLYQLSPPAQTGGAWTYALLHSFTGKDGSFPEGVVSLNGKLFGTALSGGRPIALCDQDEPFVQVQGCGTVFEVQF